MRYLISISLIAIIYFLILLGALYLTNSITFYVRNLPLSTLLYLTVTAIIAFGLLNLSLFAGRMITSEATLGTKIAGATLVIVGAVFLWRYYAAVDTAFLPILGSTAYIPLILLFSNRNR